MQQFISFVLLSKLHIHVGKINSREEIECVDVRWIRIDEFRMRSRVTRSRHVVTTCHQVGIAQKMQSVPRLRIGFQQRPCALLRDCIIAQVDAAQHLRIQRKERVRTKLHATLYPHIGTLRVAEFEVGDRRYGLGVGAHRVVLCRLVIPDQRLVNLSVDKIVNGGYVHVCKSVLWLDVHDTQVLRHCIVEAAGLVVVARNIEIQCCGERVKLEGPLREHKSFLVSALEPAQTAVKTIATRVARVHFDCFFVRLLRGRESALLLS